MSSDDGCGRVRPSSSSQSASPSGFSDLPRRNGHDVARASHEPGRSMQEDKAESDLPCRREREPHARARIELHASEWDPIESLTRVRLHYGGHSWLRGRCDTVEHSPSPDLPHAKRDLRVDIHANQRARKLAGSGPIVARDDGRKRNSETALGGDRRSCLRHESPVRHASFDERRLGPGSRKPA
jgi:hypothetical protein